MTSTIGLAMLIGVTLCALAMWLWARAKRASAVASSAATEALCSEIVFGPSADRPVLSISALQQPTIPPSARAIDRHGTGIDRLAPLLQAVPGLLSAGEFANGEYMRVVIDGPLALNADGDAFRPFTRGVNGKIDQMAVLHDPNGLSALVNTAALLNIASVVVAQKHLADISAKLDDIKQGVDRIAAFQRDQRKSVITGAMKYFQQVADPILHGELSQALRQKLEDYEAKLGEVQDHLAAELKREAGQIETLKDTGISSKKIYDAIKAKQDAVGTLIEQWSLCLRARAAGLQLLHAFPEPPRLKAARLHALESELCAFTSHAGVVYEIEFQLNQRIGAMKSFVDSISGLWKDESTLDSRKLELADRTEAIFVRLHSEAESMRNELDVGTVMLQDQQRPIALAVRMADGKLLEAYELPAEWKTA